MHYYVHNHYNTTFHFNLFICLNFRADSSNPHPISEIAFPQLFKRLSDTRGIKQYRYAKSFDDIIYYDKALLYELDINQTGKAIIKEAAAEAKKQSEVHLGRFNPKTLQRIMNNYLVPIMNVTLALITSTFLYLIQDYYVRIPSNTTFKQFIDILHSIIAPIFSRIISTLVHITESFS